MLSAICFYSHLLKPVNSLCCGGEQFPGQTNRTWTPSNIPHSYAALGRAGSFQLLESKAWERMISNRIETSLTCMKMLSIFSWFFSPGQLGNLHTLARDNWKLTGTCPMCSLIADLQVKSTFLKQETLELKSLGNWVIGKFVLVYYILSSGSTIPDTSS